MIVTFGNDDERCDDPNGNFNFNLKKTFLSKKNLLLALPFSESLLSPLQKLIIYIG